jgi:alpha/beta superfamily hydrolase
MQPVILSGHAGLLEALLDEPALEPGGEPGGEPIASVLLCHPHPPSGGTMNTHAVFRAMRALRGLGCEVLRFNFRGVGKSAGHWDDGRGELDDGRAALAWLRDRSPERPMISGGFSFGSWVGMTIGVEVGVEGLLGLGVPFASYDLSRVDRSPLPKAFVLGDHDEFTAVPAIEAAVRRMSDPKRLWIVEGTTHLFTERLDAYEATVREAGNWLLEEMGVSD